MQAVIGVLDDELELRTELRLDLELRLDIELKLETDLELGVILELELEIGGVLELLRIELLLEDNSGGKDEVALERLLLARLELGLPTHLVPFK